jgi:hypothetical protein
MDECARGCGDTTEVAAHMRPKSGVAAYPCPQNPTNAGSGSLACVHNHICENHLLSPGGAGTRWTLFNVNTLVKNLFLLH